MMKLRRRKKHSVHETDGDRRLQTAIVISLVKLRLVKLRPVIENALRIRLRGRHLHFDVIQAPVPVAGLDVQNRKLVVQQVFFVKWVQDLHIDDLLRKVGAEDGVEQRNQQGLVRFAAKKLLERVIYFRIDAKDHAFLAPIGTKLRSGKVSSGRLYSGL